RWPVGADPPVAVVNAQPRLALGLEFAVGKPAVGPGRQRRAAAGGDPSGQTRSVLLVPPVSVGVAEPVLASAAAAATDRALRRLLQPAPVRRRRGRPVLDVVGAAVVDPALVMGRALPADHGEAFADRDQTRRAADNRIVGVDQDDRLREPWP